MARTIKDIQSVINADLQAKHPTLSNSAVAQWRLLTWVVATAIYTFELILDAFRVEIDAAADKITPGTLRWYVEQCKRFQNGHELKFNEQTAQLYYENDDPTARIISVVAATEGIKKLSIKVAKLDSQNKIIPLTADELYNFTGYVDSIKFAGIETMTVSTNADLLKYKVEVYFDPAVPVTTVKANILTALDRFRSDIGFNSMLYRQRFVDAIMSVQGVVTVELLSLTRKGTSMADFADVAVSEELESGYFDYTSDSEIILTSSRMAR